MSRTLTLEGDVNAVDTRVVLTAQGSVSAPSLVVPSGMTKIKSIICAAATDNQADDGAVVFLLRLGGNAVMNGESTIFFGGAGGQTVQSGSDAAPTDMTPFVLDDADIEVRASDTISVAAEMAGIDPGDATVMVTVVFGQ